MQYPEKENINHEVTVILLKRIIELLDTKEDGQESIGVNNLDEIKAHLRNELVPVIKSIKDGSDNSAILKALKTLSEKIESIEFNPTINVAGATVTVPDVIVPQINVPEINVPAPQVTVNSPEVNIPAPIVNVPAPIVNVEATNLDSIIKALEVNLNKLRTNSETRPLAVRISDGQQWVKELKQLNRQAMQTTQYMSDVSYSKSRDGQLINPSTAEGQALGLLIPTTYDYISFSPAANPTTIIFKTGGVSGTTVGTLTLTYSGNDVETVART